MLILLIATFLERDLFEKHDRSWSARVGARKTADGRYGVTVLSLHCQDFLLGFTVRKILVGILTLTLAERSWVFLIHLCSFNYIHTYIYIFIIIDCV